MFHKSLKRVIFQALSGLLVKIGKEHIYYILLEFIFITILIFIVPINPGDHVVMPNVLQTGLVDAPPNSLPISVPDDIF